MDTVFTKAYYKLCATISSAYVNYDSFGSQFLNDGGGGPGGVKLKLLVVGLYGGKKPDCPT